MVGLIQKLLLDFVHTTARSEAVARVKQQAGVPRDRVFHLNEVYDDEEWQRLLAATCEALDVTQSQAEEAYADFFAKDSLQRWPTWFKMAKNAREFLVRQPQIHNGFATSQQDAALRSAIDDKFEVEERNGDLVVHYESPNQLCGLYMALARWIIDHYGDKAVVEEERCAKNGASECEIHIRWSQDIEHTVSSHPSQPTDTQQLHHLVEELADQPCPAVDGEFDFLVKVSAYDESIQKLQMLVNLVLDAARRSLSSLKRRNNELKAARDEFRQTAEELTEFNKVVVDRELRMIELKKEINALTGELGCGARYDVSFDDDGYPDLGSSNPAPPDNGERIAEAQHVQTASR